MKNQIKQSIKHTLESTFHYVKGTRQYLRDVLFLHFVMIFLFVPTLVQFSRKILQLGDVKTISYNNLSQIMFHHPLVFLGLLFSIVLMIWVVYFEFNFLTISMYFITKKCKVSLQQLVRMTLSTMRHFRKSIFLFFFFYFFLILPFGGLAAHSDVLSTIKIPAFVMDFIFSNRKIFVVGWAVSYCICLYLGYRFIFVLPLLTLRKMHLKEAVKESWILSKQRFLRFVFQIVAITGLILLLYSLSNAVFIGIEKVVEIVLPGLALKIGVVLMLFMQVGSILNVVLSMFAIYFVTINHLHYLHELPEIPKWFHIEEPEGNPLWVIPKVLFVGVFSFGLAVYLAQYNTDYLSKNDLSTPILISHRGVTEKNGVQNTIPALEKTAKLHPAFVEMDIQETKDKQFVVMHDPTLETLANVDKGVGELTLSQLKKVTVHENGMKAPLATFDDYLKAADRMGQKLLIELKIYDHYTKDYVDIFLKKYKEDIIKRGHHVHSLSYALITEMKNKAPEIYCSYILPFNIVGPPESKANAYTMEYSTLNSSFVSSVQEENKQVLAWTVNDMDSFQRMRSLKVDGIITDDLQLCQRTLKNSDKKIPYSEKLFIYSLGLDVN